MKQTLYAIALLLILSTSACSKATTYTCTAPCAECEKVNEGEVRICQEDYDLVSEYNYAVNTYITQGYACNTVEGDIRKDVSENMLKGYGVKGYTCVED
ncbi:MAG: hypothetical protein JST49_16040 [Bacteroidetes bacterium]|nr:hypothetical protein [Bacteroidota bacterium]